MHFSFVHYIFCSYIAIFHEGWSHFFLKKSLGLTCAERRAES